LRVKLLILGTIAVHQSTPFLFSLFFSFPFFFFLFFGRSEKWRMFCMATMGRTRLSSSVLPLSPVSPFFFSWEQCKKMGLAGSAGGVDVRGADLGSSRSGGVIFSFFSFFFCRRRKRRAAHVLLPSFLLSKGAHATIAGSRLSSPPSFPPLPFFSKIRQNMKSSCWNWS